jgi:hypothetical protein
LSFSLGTLALVAALACGCGDGKRPGGAAPDGDGSEQSAGAENGDGQPPSTADACATPKEGCPCVEDGLVIECGNVSRHSEGYTWCSMGQRTCVGDTWGSCEGDKVAKVADASTEQHTQGLGSSQACVGNPCDPYCQVVVDDSKQLDVGTAALMATNDALTLLAVPPDPNANNCTAIKLDPPTQTLTVTAINPTSGLYAEFFNQFNKTVPMIPASWPVTASRVDPIVDFSWGNAAPGPAGIGADAFSVRWSATVIPPTTEDYTFYTRTDDGARLWINGSLVIDKWVDQGATEVPSTVISLTKGTPVDLRMEYYENSGGATAQLKWSSASIAKQIIPESYLRPPSGVLPPIVTSPSAAQINVSVVPPTCYEGTVTPAWALDTLDRATVAPSGAVSLASPVAGMMKVSGYVQEFKDTASINVVVNAVDSTSAPTGSAAIFAAGTTTGADTTTILYPYDATVLPLALKPPVLQWDPGANTATAVKITLSYPAVGAPTFSWSKIIAPPSNYRYAFPRDPWSYFERTAKGSTGKITLQRIVGGALKDAISKTVTFASTPLRGRIYYTQYGGGSKIMKLDPGGDIPAVNAFPTENGCPVCHSMSANGTKFATAPGNSSIYGGISSVDAAGNLTTLSGFANPSSPYSDGGGDFRGFAWAPFTPDGKYIFTGNSIYGNTKQAVVGIDPATRTVSLPAALISGSRGIGLQADYYANTTFSGPSWRRIDPRPEFDWPGSPGGPIAADGFSVVWSGDVEGYFSENHTFEVETTAGVRLTVGGTVIIDQLAYSGAATKFTGTAALTRGVRTPIKLEAIDQNSQTLVKLRWQSAQVPYGLIPQNMLWPANGRRGPLVTYADTSGNSRTVIESDIYQDWGSGRPILGVNTDNFTSTWDALVEAPITGNLQWCIKSDDGVTFDVDGVNKLNATVVTDTCLAAMAVVEGQKYAIHIVHTEKTGSAYIQLSWQTATLTREPVPMARIFPPASFSTPATGLSATFYDTIDYGTTSLVPGSTPQAYRTFVPNLDYSWSSARHSYGRALTDSDTWSARFTGRLQPACTGIHEIQLISDDGAYVWIGNERIVGGSTNSTRTGAIWLDAAKLYDFKAEWFDNTGGATMRVLWKPACNAAAAFVAIPEANFKPTGDTTLNGYLRQGGDNWTGYRYYAWETPNAVGAQSVDVTSQSPGNWGLGNTAMMVPSFAPDGSKMVFVDGDSATNAGWRKGLSTFDFDQAGKTFKNRRQMVNNFPYGDVIKWPVFESDSKSVMYQTTTPGDMCCRNSHTLYGYMGPTNYFEDPGKLWSLDTTAASPAPVALSKLNDGERAVDRNKAYQVTMLPTTAGGFRWAVFTSTRPYGNTINLPAVQQDYSDTNNYVAMTNESQLQSMLWVSAIDDATSAATDRSHPAFFLPNQVYSETGGQYLNERAYWVTEACRAAGNGAESACDVDEDCCGGSSSPKTGVCRIDSPVTQPPTRHCASVPAPNACFAAGAACSLNSDCCFNYPCVSNVCTKPPPLPTYHPENFKRMYTSECGRGTFPVWRFFDWQAETPPIDSAIEIYAESSNDPSTFHTLPVAPAPVAISGVVKIYTITGATVSGWVGQDVGAKLKAASLTQGKYLMITLRLIPNTKITATPKLTGWRQAYSCPPAE